MLSVPYSDFSRVYKAVMGNESDYIHSQQEQQARYAYGKDYNFNPKIFKMYGYCPLECDECIETMEFNKEIMSGVFS